MVGSTKYFRQSDSGEMELSELGRLALREIDDVLIDWDASQEVWRFRKDTTSRMMMWVMSVIITSVYSPLLVGAIRTFTGWEVHFQLLAGFLVLLVALSGWGACVFLAKKDARAALRMMEEARTNALRELAVVLGKYRDVQQEISEAIDDSSQAALFLRRWNIGTAILGMNMGTLLGHRRTS